MLLHHFAFSLRYAATQPRCVTPCFADIAATLMRYSSGAQLLSMPSAFVATCQLMMLPLLPCRHLRHCHATPLFFADDATLMIFSAAVAVFAAVDILHADTPLLSRCDVARYADADDAALHKIITPAPLRCCCRYCCFSAAAGGLLSPAAADYAAAADLLFRYLMLLRFDDFLAFRQASFSR